jgi:hypothetical protein
MVLKPIGLGLGGLLVIAGHASSQQSTAWVAKASAPSSDAPAVTGSALPVAVAGEVIQGWSYLYRFVDEAEFVLCLEGYESGGRIVIDGFRLARMQAAGPTTVRYQPCDIPRYVGTAHNHPPASGDPPACYRSIPDRESFAADPKAVVDILLCGEERWVWFLRDGRTGATFQGQPAAPASESAAPRPRR